MRLPEITPEELTGGGREVYDALRSGPRSAATADLNVKSIVGPYGVWVRAPAIGGPTQALGAAVRFAGGLPEAVKEAAICTVGAHYRSKFEFAAHERLAQMAGIEQRHLDALREGRRAEFTGQEAVAHRVAAELLESHAMSDETYAAAVEEFGTEGVIELVTTVGYYCLISLTLNAFEIPLPPDWEDPFPEGD